MVGGSHQAGGRESGERVASRCDQRSRSVRNLAAEYVPPVWRCQLVLTSAGASWIQAERSSSISMSSIASSMSKPMTGTVGSVTGWEPFRVLVAGWARAVSSGPAGVPLALLRSGCFWGRSRCRVSPVELSHQLAVGLAGAVEVFGCAPECVVELADVGLEGVDLLAE